jgi:hypothetical protein
MKKTLNILFLNLFLTLLWINISYANYNGTGKLKIEDEMIDPIIDYLGAGHAANRGTDNNGKGLWFAITTNGNMIGYTYCPSGMSCHNVPIPAIKGCRKNVKEYLSTKEECKILFKGRKIVWNNSGYSIPLNATRDRIIEILTELGLYGENSKKTNNGENNSNKEIIKSLTDLKNLYDQGILTKEEFTKAKNKILN